MVGLSKYKPVAQSPALLFFLKKNPLTYKFCLRLIVNLAPPINDNLEQAEEVLDSVIENNITEEFDSEEHYNDIEGAFNDMGDNTISALDLNSTESFFTDEKNRLSIVNGVSCKKKNLFKADQKTSFISIVAMRQKQNNKYAFIKMYSLSFSLTTNFFEENIKFTFTPSFPQEIENQFYCCHLHFSKITSFFKKNRHSNKIFICSDITYLERFSKLPLYID